VVLASVSSDEPDDGRDSGDGNLPRDIQGADPGQADFDVLLRAERGGGGRGRTYTLLYAARDASGNDARASATVRVPRP
jgi:hypothetical protein